jgi:outer membrane cobalamin receptor
LTRSPASTARRPRVENHRGVLDAQATYSGAHGPEGDGRRDGEDETTQDNGYGNIDQRQTFFAAFAEDEWHPADLDLPHRGVRYDDFDTFGSSVTGRVTPPG